MGAYVTSALAIAGAAVALGVQYGIAEPRYNEFLPLQHAFSDQPATLGQACQAAGHSVVSGNSDDCYSWAKHLASQGNDAQWAARAVGVAAVSAGLGACFWAAGEDPGRYDSYRGLGFVIPPQMAIPPIKGGAVVSLRLSFEDP